MRRIANAGADTGPDASADVSAHVGSDACPDTETRADAGANSCAEVQVHSYPRQPSLTSNLLPLF